MSGVVAALRGIGSVLYDLVVGDDWRIGAAVLAALALTWLTAWAWPWSAGAGVAAVVGGVAVMTAFGGLMLRDARRS